MKTRIPGDHSRIPISHLIQEGCDKQYMCNKDKPELVRWGLDWNLVEELTELLRVCSKEETEWQILNKEKQIATATLNENAALGRKVRSTLAGLIRKTKLFKSSGHKLPAYRNRRGLAAIIEDLYDLHILGKQMLKADTACFPDSSYIDKALAMHNLIRTINNSITEYKSDLAACLQRRNNAAKTLKKAIDTINEAGQKAFIESPERGARYSLFYYRQLNKQRPAQKKNSRKR